jgi:hypothetical protein
LKSTLRAEIQYEQGQNGDLILFGQDAFGISNKALARNEYMADTEEKFQHQQSPEHFSESDCAFLTVVELPV